MKPHLPLASKNPTWIGNHEPHNESRQICFTLWPGAPTMIKVFTASNPTEAHLVQGILGAAGVQAAVRGEALFSVDGGASVASMCPSVWVQAEPDQVARAKQIVAHFRGSAPEQEDQPWTCSGCAELHEAQFTDCWKCGTARP